MPLYLVPTPIGNFLDFSRHAIETLNQSEVIVVEEFKESSKQLRSVGIQGKQLEQLNEHSTESDYHRVVELCKIHWVSFITDCGTPGFCDPGAELVRLCRAANVKISALPGPSSLMTAISLSGRYLNEFHFRGFLPAESNERHKSWHALKPLKVPTFIMDTPYRLKKTLMECSHMFMHHKILLTLNLTQPTEWVFEGTAQEALNKLPLEKAEFMLLIYP